jgi:hypothetical protein
MEQLPTGQPPSAPEPTESGSDPRREPWIHNREEANAWWDVAEHLIGLTADNLGNPEIEPVHQRAMLAIATMVHGMVHEWMIVQPHRARKQGAE